MEHAIKGEFSMIKGWKADSRGNIIFKCVIAFSSACEYTPFFSDSWGVWEVVMSASSTACKNILVFFG